MSWSSTSDECKECSLEKLNKECMKRDLKGIPERDSCMQIEDDNLVENLQCTAEAWWIFPINIKMTTQ